MANFRNIISNSSFKKFFSANDGAVALMVGIMMVLIIAVLMITVDLSRVQSGSTNNQAAIDAAALGAAEYAARYRIVRDTQEVPADLQEYTKKVFLQNLSNDQSDATLATDLPTDFQVTVVDDAVAVYACLNIKTGFAQASGNGDYKKVCNTSKASLPAAGGNIEIVFALDVSDSMSYRYTLPDGSQITKIDALKQSISSLMATYGSNNSIYWGVVPYSGMVDLGNFAPNIVADDLNEISGRASANSLILGLPQNNLQPASELHASESVPVQRAWAYNAFEDAHMDNFRRVFNETDCYPGPLSYTPGNINYCGDYALHMLQRIPLTSRDGNERPEERSTIVLDDAPPVAGNKFQAYWHHPYDFFLDFDQHDIAWDAAPQDGACGTCYESSRPYERQVGGGTCAPEYDYPCQYPEGQPGRLPPEQCTGTIGEGSGQ